MDQVMQFVEPSRQFVKDSIRLVKRCTKPDRKGTVYTLLAPVFVVLEGFLNPKINLMCRVCSLSRSKMVFVVFWRLFLPPSEFQKIAMATAIGFAIMGFIGFFVKLIHIPINNIIV